jgi:uncharacterized repeat protein (TIGR01451 family)
MKSKSALFSLLWITLTLLALALLLNGTRPAMAAPLAAITPSLEPPTPQPTDTAQPTVTPVPTLTPDSTPPPQPTLTPTSAPTLTPSMPTSTPTKPPKDDDETADPSLTKAVEPAEARIGDEVYFNLTVTNQGDAAAQDVVVTDDVPAAFDILAVSADRGEVAVNGNTVVASLGTVEPGETITIRISTRVNDQAPLAEIFNTGVLTTSAGTDIVSNNAGAAKVAILASVQEPTPPVETPVPTPPASPVPSAPPAPPVSAGATVRPPGLPDTGGPVAHGSWPGALIGLGAVVAGLLVRRKKVKRPPES